LEEKANLMHPNLLLSVNDLYGCVVCFLFSLIFLRILYKNWINDKKIFRLFLIGFLCKSLAVIVSAYFNLYIIQADSTKYYSSAISVSTAIKNLPFRDYIKIFYTDFPDLPFKVKCFFSNSEFFNLVYDNHKTLVHISAIIGFFTFNSYVAISFFLSLWAYVGIWLIYKTFVNRYPESQKLLYLFIVLFPSLIFWTTGVMKEPLCIGAVGIIFYHLFNKQEASRKKTVITIFALLSVFLLFKVKTYIIFAIMISSILYFLITFIQKHNLIVKLFMLIVISLTLFITAYFYSSFIQEKIISTLTDEITDKISTVTNAQLEHGGSSYDLGELNLNGIGIIKYCLSAINVTLFRPYLWEYLNPLVLISALESLLMFIALLWILLSKKWTSTFKFFIKSPPLMFSIFFVLFLGIMVGGIAFNYGTLARYKTPLVPFFSAVLIITASNKNITRGFFKKIK